MSRRAVVGGLAALPLAGRVARAEVPLAAYVSTFRPGDVLDTLIREAMIQGLAEHGFVIPDRLRWTARYTDADLDRPKMVLAVQSLTRALVAEGVQVILAPGPATTPAIAAAGSVPVVYGFSGDPIAAGLADSLAKPRGNATGITLMFVETNAKRIGLLKELAPSVRRIALLSSPNHPGEQGEIEVCRRTVAQLGIEMLYMPVYGRDDVEKALLAAASRGVDALVALPDPVTNPNRAWLADWARERRIPYVSGSSIHAESGGVMTYGPNLAWSYSRVGFYAARVLRGAKPAELPIEQPTRFELVLNLATAKAIGLAVPDGVIAQADRIIE